MTLRGGGRGLGLLLPPPNFPGNPWRTMDHDEASRWRNLLGKAGAACCFLLFLTLLDGLIAQFQESFNVFKVLPGTSVEINGPLQEEVRDVRDLTYTSSSEHLRLSFAAAHRGYFLGGDMWRGHLTVSPQIQPGEYSLTVSLRGKTSPKPPPAYRIMVYPDSLSLRQSSRSLIRRYTGISPWLVPLSFLPLIFLAFGMVYYLSQKLEALLARAGKGEVYRVTRREGDCEIRFGLGTAHGVKPGAVLTISNELGQTVGTVQVQEASLTDSLAIVGGDQEIKPGYIVSLPPT